MPLPQSIMRMTLDIREMESQLSFAVKQNDTMRRLVITLTDHNKAYIISEDCYAVFSAKTGGNTYVSEGCQIDNNEIIYDISATSAAAIGKYDCEITLFGGNGEVLATPHFTMTVYASLLSEYADEVIASDEFATLTNLITSANTAIANVNAKLSEIEQMLEEGNFETITLGSTTINETQLQELLALLE